MRWSLTGRPGVVYQLAVGVARIDSRGGTLHAVPETRDGEHTVLVSPQVKLDDGCLAHGTFGMAVDPGDYTMRLFAFAGPPSSPSAAVVATRQLTVRAQ